MNQRPLLGNAARAIAPSLLLLALLASGCSTQHDASDADPIAPRSSAGALLGSDPGAISLDQFTRNGSALMPLAVGNRWDYAIRTSTRLVEPGSPDVIGLGESTWTSEILARQPINDQEYYLQADYDPRSLAFVVAQWGLRQDRSGLYSLDLPSLGPHSAPAARSGRPPDTRFAAVLAEAAAKSRHPAAFAAAAERLAARLAIISMPGRGLGLPGLPGFTGTTERGGDVGPLLRGDPLPGEVTLLVYPMFVGSGWVARESPRYTRVVERRGRTAVPAGEFETWVLRGRSELDSPGDFVRFHYAREGLVRVTLHATLAVRDIDGSLLGHIIMDMDQSLTSFTPAGSAN